MSTNMKKTLLWIFAFMLGWASVLAAPPPVVRGKLISGKGKTSASAKPARKAASAKTTRPAAARKKNVAPVVPAAPGKGPLAPYRGAIALDADSGRVLFTDHADRTGYPASLTKMMTFFLVLEDLAAGRYTLADRAVASAYAAGMEPSKVDLKPGQSMTIEDLLYSLMIKSANDAAVVLAEHAAYRRSGIRKPQTDVPSADLVAAFVARMNRRAQELGMASTRYVSPNGLPPPAGSKRGFDVSTAADLARLARKLVVTPQALKYTAPASRTVTDGKGEKLSFGNHNYFVPGNIDPKRFCTPVPECDGLKTGYTEASGSSIALTAKRNGRRVVVVVLGSAGRWEREAAAGRLLRDALGAVSVW